MKQDGEAGPSHTRTMEEDYTEPVPTRRPFSWASGEDVVETRRRSRDASPMSQGASTYYAELFQGKWNPFENVHPLRGQNWNEAEDALNRRGPPERRISDVPTEEIRRVMAGYCENKQASLSDKDLSGRMERYSDGIQDASLDAIGYPLGRSITPTSEVEDSDTRTLRFWSADGKKVLKEIPLDHAPLGLEANLSPKSFSRELQKMDFTGQVGRLRHEIRRIGESPGLAETMVSSDKMASLALRNTTFDESTHPERMSPDDGSMTALTSPKEASMATYPDTRRPALAPAASPLQLPERIKSLEAQAKSVGDWDKVFEETGDPKLSEPEYCAALVRPERVEQTQIAFNARYDALVRGDFTKTGANGKLVRIPRPELPSRYHFRPKKPISPSTPAPAPAEHNSIPASSTHNTEGVDDESTEVDDLPESPAFIGWKHLGLAMDDNPGPERPSGQSASIGKEKQSTEADVRRQPDVATFQHEANLNSDELSPDSPLETKMEHSMRLSQQLDSRASLKKDYALTAIRPDAKCPAEPKVKSYTALLAEQSRAEQEAGSIAVERSKVQTEPVSEAAVDHYGLPSGPVGDAVREYSRRRLGQRVRTATADQTYNRGPPFNPHRAPTEEQPAHPDYRGSSRAFSGREDIQSLSNTQRVQISIGWGIPLTEERAVYGSEKSERLQREMREQQEKKRLEDRRRANEIYPGHKGFRGEDYKTMMKERSERKAEMEMERRAVEESEGEEAGEKKVMGRLTAEALHELEMQYLMHGPPRGRPTDADLELSQNLRALARSTAAPLHPQPQPPSINVTAPTPRPDSIADFDHTLVPGPLRPCPRPRPRPRQTQVQDSESFLGARLASDRDSDMDRLQVRSTEFSSVKAKAVEDARQMQAHVIEECTKAGKDPPPYGLVELIGKGSFGRVYMGKDMKSAAIVAVKIIDIDESDTLNPRIADSYSEFLKEVNALKILSENKAKNINHVIEALPVNQAMWMITEHCGGGSVATLMKPSAPAGLMEKWIIPILREVAEALKWVHQAGIIHRDIKCANVLITEQGGVQLCDFGVAGIIENKLDKRSTIIGTPHWMAPELFNDTPSYGKEVDIWAFGAMTYEIATGLPPNVANGIPYERLGSHLKKNVPRLEGGDYSNELRNMVAYLLEEDPSARPTIEQVQKHRYIANTSSTYPTTNLRSLVGSFRVWESRGGDRKSLFMQHGAQGPSYASSGQDEWNFSTTEVFDQKVMEEFSAQDVFDAYGPSISFDEATARPNQRQPTKASRRRPPPEALARMPAPLEKIFDPNTMTNYEDNSRVHYGKAMTSAPSTSDLPLRDDSAQTSIKDTMIDLGGHDSETGISSFSDMDTIKAGRRQDENEDQYNSTLHDFSRPALSDPADINTNRRTQDWKFPSMAPPASADPELSRFPPASYELPRPTVTPGSGGRPTLVHHPTEPVGAFSGGLLGTTTSAMGRMSMRESLIDLDMSLPDSIPEIRRPSTANSDVSASSEQMTSGNPFELERHASQLYQPVAERGSDHAIYISEESAVPTRLRNGNLLQDIADMSDFSASDVEGPQANGRARRLPQYDGADDSDYQAMPPPPLPNQAESQTSGQPYTMAHFPPLPPHPSIAALTGTASNAEMQDELRQALAGLNAQLSAFKDVYSSIEGPPRRGSAPARQENAQD